MVMDMEWFLMIVVIVALAAAFLIGLLTKLGAVEYVQVHGDRILSQMFSCDFCLSFWACTVMMIYAACITDTFWLVFCGAFSCPITRSLI